MKIIFVNFLFGDKVWFAQNVTDCAIQFGMGL